MKFSLRLLPVGFIILLLCSPMAHSSPLPKKNWPQRLRKKMLQLDQTYPGKFGVFIKDLSTNTEFSFRGEKPWYVASGIKLPVAIAILKEIDSGKLNLETEITIRSQDFIDGAGQTNYKSAGSKVSIRFLLEQMLIYSDNTATDILIKKVSLEKINKLIIELSPKNFFPITSLLDVRRLAYGELHPKAHQLSGLDFIAIRKAGKDQDRVKTMQGILKISNNELLKPNLDEAFSAYYMKNLNSASLRSYSRVLEKIIKGQILNPSSQKFLITTMSHVKTGQNRLRAGFPKNFVIAHKTGTQYRRVCDFGWVWDKKNPSRKIIISACSRDIAEIKDAEKLIKDIASHAYEALK